MRGQFQNVTNPSQAFRALACRLVPSWQECGTIVLVLGRRRVLVGVVLGFVRVHGSVPLLLVMTTVVGSEFLWFRPGQCFGRRGRRRWVLASCRPSFGRRRSRKDGFVLKMLDGDGLSERVTDSIPKRSIFNTVIDCAGTAKESQLNTIQKFQTQTGRCGNDTTIRLSRSIRVTGTQCFGDHGHGTHGGQIQSVHVTIDA